MPSLSERHRNNIRAGVFVTVALIVSMGVVVALTDAVGRLSRVTHEYRVSFEVSSGVANLKSGSDVRVGGMQMGRVLDVTPEYPDPSSDQPLRRIIVRFNIDRAVDLRENAKVFVTAPLIGSDAWIEIPDVGDGAALPEGTLIAGASGAGFLTSLVGPANADKVEELLDLFPELKTDYTQTVKPTLENMKAITDDSKGFVNDLRTVQWPRWSKQVDEIMTWALAMREKIDSAVSDGQAILSNSRGIVEENRQDIRDSVANVRDVSETAKTETMVKLNNLLDSGREGLDNAKAVLDTFSADYEGWASNVSDALARFNLTSQQLKLASTELRRSPWKLLYRPSADELEHELLYDAARAFAVAAADLRATSEAVNRILTNHGDRVAANQDLYRRLETKLLNSMANYEKAQQDILDVLASEGKP
jgi:ABC-type transporter Mla subunit MlaD